MSTDAKEKDDLIKVKHYLTDSEGHTVAAVIDLEELHRLEELIEDLSDLKVIEDREGEPTEDYETYSSLRKSHIRR
ncbi:MAG: hypothetical protein AABZ11_09585 [Nitrospinota bacterium]